MAQQNPVFGPNGAVMNGEAMTDELRGKYENASPFWRPDWKLFAEIATMLAVFGGAVGLSALWLPSQLVKHLNLSIEHGYVASAAIAVSCYIVWVIANSLRRGQISLSNTWGTIGGIALLCIIVEWGYEFKTGTRLISGWMLTAAGVSYLAICFVIKRRARRVDV